MSEETPATEPVKRPRGRPRKNPVIERDVNREPIKTPSLKMRARPNWENIEADEDETPDRLRIPNDLIPEGMSAQWVSDSVLGQGVPQHRSSFERRGWTPVHQEDFDGRFNGLYMPRDKQGEINVDGLVLMVRPKNITDKARQQDKARAREQVNIKEQSLRGGDLAGVSLDSQHPTALRTNRINKTVERIEVPDSK